MTSTDNRADDNRADELIRALQASWPRREALGGFAADFAAEFKLALEKLTQGVPNHKLESVQAPLKEVAITLANGYLAEQTKAGSHHKLADLVAEAAQHGSLTDVLLTAGCALHDDACNARLLELVNRDVAKNLTFRWGPGKAKSVIDDLPSHLHQQLPQGYNRGRMRLLDFYGRSTLATWLQTVATRLAIDRARAAREEPDKGDVPLDPARPAADPEREQVLRKLIEVAPRVAAELIESLRQASPQQHHAAVMRLQRGYSNSEIADRLGCSKPAVTQLLDKVSRKFLELLSAADPCLEDVVNAPSRKDKKWIEEAIYALIQADAATATADSPHAHASRGN